MYRSTFAAYRHGARGPEVIDDTRYDTRYDTDTSVVRYIIVYGDANRIGAVSGYVADTL